MFRNAPSSCLAHTESRLENPKLTDLKMSLGSRAATALLLNSFLSIYRRSIRCAKSVLIAVRSCPVWKAAHANQLDTARKRFPGFVSVTKNMIGVPAGAQAAVFFWVAITTKTVPARFARCAASRFFFVLVTPILSSNPKETTSFPTKPCYHTGNDPVMVTHYHKQEVASWLTNVIAWFMPV